MEVYHMIDAFCKEIAVTWRKTQRTNLALAVRAIFQRRTLTLSHLAQHFPCPEKPRVAEPRHPLWHRLKRLRRFLGNPRLKTEDLFRRLTRLGLCLSDEPGLRLSVLVDLTYFDPYAFLVASIPKLGRALPLAWYAFRRDLLEEPFLSQNLLIEHLLQQLLAEIPEKVKVILCADREFARLSFFRFAKKIKRHFVVRIDAETWIIHPEYSGALGQMGLQPGDPPRWFKGALYCKEDPESINLLAVWVKGYSEPWFLATTLGDRRIVYRIYKQRMKIEHGFRDWKHHLRLKGTLRAQNVRFVKGLMTVLAVLYWFVCLFGLHWLGRRHWSRVACWGQPGFFKVALDLLTTADPLVSSTWQAIHSWVRDKLELLKPLMPTYLLRYRRHRPWLQQSG
jgi:hypothetical protein